jgi:hypothetical protein
VVQKCGILKRKQIITNSGNAFFEVTGKECLQEKQSPKAYNREEMDLHNSILDDYYDTDTSKERQTTDGPNKCSSGCH